MRKEDFTPQLTEWKTETEFVDALRFRPTQERLEKCWRDYKKWKTVTLEQKKIDGIMNYAIFTSED